MTTLGDPRPTGAAGAAHGLDLVAAPDLSTGLDAIAERVAALYPVDLVAVHLVDETDADGLTHGYCVGPSLAAQAIAPLLTPEGIDPIGIGEVARRDGLATHWPRLVSEPAELERLAALADQGGPAGALHRLLLDASGLAVPFGTPHHPQLGAVALVNLRRDAPLPEGAMEGLAELAPQIALTARNHQLTARNRRNRQTLEGVISSSRMGVVVSDLRGRLSIANVAAEEILGIDLEQEIGSPFGRLIDERIKWRFVNPDEYAAAVRGIHRDPAREAVLEVETVDGRVIEHTTSPVRDQAGGLAGRVHLLYDVTRARAALAEAQRLAAERAELLEREERRTHEEMALATAARQMASAATPADIGELLLAHARGLVPRGDKSVVLLSDRRGRVLPLAALGFSHETVARMEFRAGEGIVGRAMVGRRAFVCNDTEVDGRISTRLTQPEGIRSFVHLPLSIGERSFGLVNISSGRPRAFNERDVRMLTALVRDAAGALQSALQVEQDRHIAETLQQALLTDRLPAVPGLELGALYQAAAGAQVGGDFYNAWVLPDGRLALLVGDVSGKGVEAAGVTAMVRYMAEALSQHRDDPGVLVAELNDLLCPRMPEGGLVTLILATIDIAADELRWCAAGHPPPVLLRPGGEHRTLEDPDPPCGVFPGQSFRTSVADFRRGDMLVLYTDGVIEARRPDGRELGEEALREALCAAADEGPDQVARSAYTAARTWSGGRLTDDVAVAVVRRTP